jgi:hypothetical protein
MQQKEGVPSVPPEARSDDEDLRTLALRPTERGIGVHGTAGNGSAQIAARTMMMDGDAEWRDSLDADYIADMIAMEPTYFTCLGCDAWI